MSRDQRQTRDYCGVCKSTKPKAGTWQTANAISRDDPPYDEFVCNGCMRKRVNAENELYEYERRHVEIPCKEADEITAAMSKIENESRNKLPNL